ncbi:PAS domain-containing serine/threonine-protein kinase [Holothuria leucospilota]|uniref:PAS domain-containing serine/threonine-protein kinase n=1 Tax=Holothuria leucospilota TaxID=206669 RepID=A0A9Q1BCL8_HOLLE|nr:PAS domain-containing serine/threonine-protein kinase [Holothuria leucospilota]
MASDGGTSPRREEPADERGTRVKPKPALKIEPSLNFYKQMGPQKLSQSFGGTMMQKEQFGSPSYPSPLDRIRTGKKIRGSQLGLSESFTSLDFNKTYPCKTAKSKPVEPLSALPEIRCTLEDFKGDELNTFSFSQGVSKGSLSKTGTSQYLSSSMGQSWAFYNFLGADNMGASFPTTVHNPNKAILTIEARTTTILVVNKMACELFGMTAEELTGTRMTSLLSVKDRERPDVLEEHHLDTSGRVVIVSGKVFEVTDSSGLEIPVSLWMKKVTEEENPKCLVVMEPVERSTARFIFDSKGTILQADECMATLHGYGSEQELMGSSLQQLIPSITLPSSRGDLPQAVKKQQLTGKTKEGNLFPLSIHIKMISSGSSEDSAFGDEDPDFNLSTKVHSRTPDLLSSATSSDVRPSGPISGDDVYFQATVWVFANISGMLSFLPNGNIHSINNNFSLMLFGFKQHDLSGQPITELIPNFYDHLDIIDDSSMPLPPFEDDEDETDEDNLPTSRPASRFPDIVEDEALDGDAVVDHKESGEGDHSRNSVKRPNTADLLKEAEHVIRSHPVLPELRTSSTCTDDLLDSAPNEDGINHSPSVSVDITPPGSHASLEVQVGNLSIPGSIGNLSSISGVDEVDRLSNSGCNTEGEDAKQKLCFTKSTDLGIYSFSKEKLRRHSDGTSVTVKSPPEEPLIREALLRVSLDGPCNPKEAEQDGLSGKVDHYADVERWAHQVKHHFQIQESTEGFGSKTVESNRTSQCQNDLNSLKDGADMNQNIHNSNQDKCVTIEDGYREGEGSGSSESNPSVDQAPHVGLDDFFSQVHEPEKKLDILGGLQGRITSTPASKLPRQFSLTTTSSIPEGSFQGQGKHKDGNLLAILFQIKRVELQDGSFLYCMWLSRDPSDPGEGGRLASSMAFASTFNSTGNISTSNNKSLGQAVAEAARANSTVMEEDLERLGSGDYSSYYKTLQSIGKGAFGFVKMGKRKRDDISVVVKFIRKSKIFQQNWSEDPKFGKLPLEIALLVKLGHPNIVKVLDFYQNEEFFQMVMEKHGSGMDLFEFIDRQPNFDESLASYMFRQLVDAVAYLHSKSIVHRDIKDENVILDERFHIKLIDFGSAAYFERGKRFSTFCGTLEYCAPEVIQGNKYEGPELEMWAMGVTLYTLVFGENPFFDIEETIQASLKPPFPVSNELMQLIAWLLHPEPEHRLTLADMEDNVWLHQSCNIEAYKWEDVVPENREIYDPSPPPEERDCSDDDEYDASMVQRLAMEYERRLAGSV